MRKRIQSAVKTTAIFGALAAGILVAGEAPSAILSIPPAWAQPADETLHEKTTKLLTKMRAEKMTAQQAFDNGLLTREILLYALGEQLYAQREQKVLDPNSNPWEANSETNQWAQLLLDKFPELAEKIGEASNEVRMRVGRLLLEKRDPRGVQVMESILNSLPREQAELGVTSYIIHNLADYYRKIGETAKSIAVSRRITEFSQQPRVISSLLLTAVRTAASAGDIETAQQLLEEIAAQGDSLMTAYAYSALADELDKVGKWKEARAVLQKPVSGEKAPAARVYLSHQLAQSYFQRGEWGEARREAQATVEQYNALPEADKDQQLSWVMESSKRLPQQIEQWQKSPVQLYTQEIKVRVAKEETEPVRTYFNVNSYRAFTAKSVSNNPNITTWPLQSPNDFPSYQMVGVEIAPDAFPKEAKGETEAEITVSFEEFPDTVFRIPVKIERLEDDAKSQNE